MQNCFMQADSTLNVTSKASYVISKEYANKKFHFVKLIIHISD